MPQRELRQALPPSYAYSHPLTTPGMRMYSDSKVSELLRAAGEQEARMPFLNR